MHPDAKCPMFRLSAKLKDLSLDIGGGPTAVAPLASKSTLDIPSGDSDDEVLKEIPAGNIAEEQASILTSSGSLKKPKLVVVSPAKLTRSSVKKRLYKSDEPSSSSSSSSSGTGSSEEEPAAQPVAKKTKKKK